MNGNSISPTHILSSEESSPLSFSEPSSPSAGSCLSFSGVSTPATEKSTNLEHFNANVDLCDDSFILVVGGLGYIGSHTSWELLRDGCSIIIIDNLSNSNRNVLAKLELLRDRQFTIHKPRPRLDFYEADYRDKNVLRTVLAKYSSVRKSTTRPPFLAESKVYGVIHFAGYKSVSESFEKPLDYYANNVGGLIDFCSTLSEFGIKTLIFSSSATVYGRLANIGGRLLEEQCDSSGCAGLTNPYGRTKWMCEAILSDIAVSDSEWTIIALRYFNPIGCDVSGLLGEDPRTEPSNLMPIVVKAMTGEHKTLSIFGTDWDTPDGTAIRDFIHVSDLALGHLAAVTATKKSTLSSGYHTFNLGTGTGYSVRDIITAMEHASGRTIPITLSKRREGDVGICIAEPSKSATILDWKAEKTLVEACYDICRNLNLAVGDAAS